MKKYERIPKHFLPSQSEDLTRLKTCLLFIPFLHISDENLPDIHHNDKSQAIQLCLARNDHKKYPKTNTQMELNYYESSSVVARIRTANIPHLMMMSHFPVPLFLISKKDS